MLEPAAVVGFEFPRDGTGRAGGGGAEGPGQRPACRRSSRASSSIRGDALADEGYRFDHILVRDAAYGALLKRERAVLHERFAGWAERTSARAPPRGPARGGARLSPRAGGPLSPGPRPPRRARPAASHRGRRAAVRGRSPRARSRRHDGRREPPEASCDPSPCAGPGRIALLPDLGEALIGGGRVRRRRRLLSMRQSTAPLPREDLPLLARAELMRLLLKANSSPPDEWSGQLESDARDIVEVLEQAGDQAGLAAASRLLSLAYCRGRPLRRVGGRGRPSD